VARLSPALSLAIKLAVTAGGVAFLVLTTDVSEIADALSDAAPLASLGSVVLLTACLIFGALRWRLLLLADGADISSRELYLVYLEAGFFGLFLPSSLGGDVFRGWRVRRQVDGIQRIAVNLIVERIVGVGSLGILGLIAVALAGELDPTARHALAIASAAVLGATAVLLSPASWIAVWLARRVGLRGLGDRLADVAEQVAGYRHRRALLPAVFVCSILQHLIAVLAIQLAATAVGLDLGFLIPLASIPAVGLMGLFPSIAGIGPREVGLAWVLESGGADGGPAVAAATVVLGALIARGLLGGLIYLIRRPSPGEGDGGGDQPGGDDGVGDQQGGAEERREDRE
jgi:hypothetical protein